MSAISIRVHVNGTRGKSSVTRLIGAGLRAAGVPTITKVTGTFPRLILEDGCEVSIHRRGDANILEQLSIVQFAADRNARALVMECMALEPQYQWITEHQMIHANVAVITNVRLDHIDIMGRTLPEIARTLGETIPKRQHLFVAEGPMSGVLADIAAKKQTIVNSTDGYAVSPDEMRGFAYIEHRENVALALAVCQHLGVERSVALKGMYGTAPDAGALRRFTISAFNKRISFYNAFAANDPESTFVIWRKIRDDVGFDGRRAILLNTRQDRLDRARQLAEMIGRNIRSAFDYLLLIGECTDVVQSMSIANGVDRGKVINIGWASPGAVFEAALSITKDASTIVGMGNMGGMGAGVAEYFERRSRSNHD